MGTELVARGVQMEAYSVEDAGDGVCFNIFAYNVQPGVIIDYATGGEPAGGGRGMKLWEQFDRIVVFDTETTGLDYRRDRIIEIGAVSLEDGVETGGMDLFIRLPEGRRLDPFIVNLTGITEERLETEGVGDEEAARAFADLLEGRSGR